MALSEAIKMTRKKALLSQNEFAKSLSVSMASVARWETGKSKPNLTAMRSIKQFCEKNNLPYSAIEQEWFANSTEEE